MKTLSCLGVDSRQIHYTSQPIMLSIYVCQQNNEQVAFPSHPIYIDQIAYHFPPIASLNSYLFSPYIIVISINQVSSSISLFQSLQLLQQYIYIYIIAVQGLTFQLSRICLHKRNVKRFYCVVSSFLFCLSAYHCFCFTLTIYHCYFILVYIITIIILLFFVLLQFNIQYLHLKNQNFCHPFQKLNVFKNSFYLFL